MRIRKITINQWRNFEGIELQIDDNTGLVCIVGANGTGKSHLLELIAACAHRLGLTPGIDTPRGDPFNDPHDFSLQFYLAEGVSDAIDQAVAAGATLNQWDRTLTLKSQSNQGNAVTTIRAGDAADGRSMDFARQVIDILRHSKNVHLVSLDANRAYPKQQIKPHDMAAAYQKDWNDLSNTRGQSYKSTTTLYDEWIKYFLAQENQSGARYIQDIRKARQARRNEPVFADHFDGYKEALQTVLPYVIFTGVDSKQQTLLFDTVGLELTFNQLSGGEREIAFLIGQIDRFRLREGLFLLDEPELHLNSELIRAWVGYLTSTVQTGQIWLATHSLEAVETAGPEATFVLERNEEMRKVDSIARLDRRPVLSALARAVGTPAFSITQLRFVLIEGEDGVGQREQFYRLAGMPQNIRFMKCGSCNEVLRRVDVIRTLATETETGIRIGGVIDRDFRSDADAAALYANQGVFVLPVHEVENFFLHPSTLQVLLEQNGRDQHTSMEMIRNAADTRAGSWVFQYTMGTSNTESLPNISDAAKQRAKALSWQDFYGSRDAAISKIIELSGYGDTDREKLKNILEIGVKAYERKRREDSLWKHCEGKEILNIVSRDVGFSDGPAMIEAVFVAWVREITAVPQELVDFRDYLSRL